MAGPASTQPELRISESDDFPALFKATDRMAAENQRAFLLTQRVELAGLVLAAVMAEVVWTSPEYNWAVLLSFVFLSAALAARVVSMLARYESKWYDARAIAESAKTLSWQFAVCGSSFPRSSSITKASSTLTSRFSELLDKIPDLDVPAGASPQAQVPSALTNLRGADLSIRKQVYGRDRILDQLGWYSDKADWNRGRAKLWAGALVSFEVLAVVFALARGLTWIDVDLPGILAAGAAAVVAWRQTKQFSTLAGAYSLTSHEVSAVASRVSDLLDEAEWADVVHEAEAAFSREHTMWVARRR